MVQSKARILYVPRAGATPESERSALASAYSIILDCYANKKAAQPGRPDDAEGHKNDRTDARIKRG
jgi:hypothetical protein